MIIKYTKNNSLSDQITSITPVVLLRRVSNKKIQFMNMVTAPQLRSGRLLTSSMSNESDSEGIRKKFQSAQQATAGLLSG